MANKIKITLGGMDYIISSNDFAENVKCVAANSADSVNIE